MTPDNTEFRARAIEPVECLKAGWATIKDRYWLFLGITLVAVLIGGAVPIVLIGPMMCGLYLCLFAKMRNEPVQFDQLFRGFDHFIPGLVAAAIQTVPILILVVAADAIFFIFMFAVMPHDRYSHDQAPPPVFFLGLVVFVLFAMIVSLTIHSLFLFAYPLIVDRKLSGWDAVKTSYRAAVKNIGGIVGLILLNAGLGIVGVICCYVGVFFVMPISFAAYAAAYRQVFPEVSQNFASPPPPPGDWAA
ncbi:MAG TPA: hypothetical protein VEM96_04190 [Pyrinomonadaceae bacterium]|nr:hypothetical protein [Pyrinomonadaceae bacterium]